MKTIITMPEYLIFAGAAMSPLGSAPELTSLILMAWLFMRCSDPWENQP